MLIRKTLILAAIGALTGLVLMDVSPLMAQEVQWRHAYVRARREAKEKNRPMMFDFGTSDCMWCKKLDSVTFRDPSVVAELNEKFVPVKVDAEQDAELTQILEIQSFPTLLFAAPDGKILGIHEGFVEPEQFSKQLQRALNESKEWAETGYVKRSEPAPTVRGQSP